MAADFIQVCYNPGMLKPSVTVSFLLTMTIIPLGFCRSKPPKPVHILCLGDSLTTSDYGNYPQYLKQWIAPIRPAKIRTVARPGNTSGQYLEFLRASDFLHRETVDFALLMLGTNDVRIDSDHTATDQFRNHMEEMIIGIRTRTSPFFRGRPRIFLATIPPIFHIDLPVFDETSRERILREINPAIRDLASRYRLRVVETETLFRRQRHLLPGIHPSKEGYQKIAREFFRAISPFLNRPHR